MKKLTTFFISCIILLTISFSNINAQDWLVYDASVLPSATEGAGGDTLDLSNVSDDSPGPGMVQEILDDPDITGNKIFKYLHPDGKTMFRYYFDDAYTDSNFTLMARVKGEPDTLFDRIFDLQWRNGNAGSRDELRIWGHEGSLELEKAGVEVTSEMDLFAWHTYRIAVSGDEATVYIDENPTPVLTGISTSTTTDKYVKIGDGSGEAIGGYLDWFILNMNGAYAPGEGSAVPAGLYVDGLETQTGWLVYDAGVLPSETADAGPGLLDLSSTSDDSPGLDMVQEIIDDDVIVGNKILKYLQPNGKTMFRYYFDDAYSDSNFTLMARIKGEPDTLFDRIFDLQWRNGNADSRDELRIWGHENRLELEKAEAEVVSELNLLNWHTYRITVSGDEATVYIDEDPTPVLTGISTSTTSDKYVKIGDGSGEAIGGYLDWFILEMSGAYAPGEGTPVPPELYVDGTPLPVMPEWTVYDGSVQPEETAGAGGDTLDISDFADESPGADMVKEIVDDEIIAGNKLFKYLQPDGKLTFRHYFDEEYSDSAFTIMARIKAEEDTTYDRAFDIRWDNGNAGTRDELRIWAEDSTIELEKVDLKVQLDVNFYEWHTFRIVVDGDYTEVYLDESQDPVVFGTTTSSSTNKYLKIGDGSGEAIGGYLDWLILDVTGAYKPNEGAPVPPGLYVDVAPQPEVPKWLVYDGNILPIETEGATGDTLDLSDVSQDAPGPGFVEEIVADPDIENNNVLKFLMPMGTKMYRYNFKEEYDDSAFTMMARVRGELEGEYDRAFDIQWRNGNANSRDQLRIMPADSTLELDRSDASVKVNFDLYKWHSYRIAVSGDTASVYMDQMSEPVLVGISTETSGDNYIKIGDGSSDAIGGYVDWFIVDMSGAYGEGEGLPVPEGLYVDKYIEPIEQMWIVYDASILPQETEGAGSDTLDISSLSSDSPGPGFVEEIIDDPDIEGNKLLKFLMPLGNRMYRYYFPDNFVSGNFTWIVRTRQEWDADSTFERGLDFQWRNADAAARDELRIDGWDKTLELEKSEVETPVEFDLFTWHTYRIAVNGAETKIYVDENPEPILTGTATESTSDRYFKFGDAGSGINGGYVDWMAIDLSGAYAPGEGISLPEALFVDDYTVGVDGNQTGLPTTYALSQNYPNPFNPSTTIKFQLPEASSVKITVYNILGQMVTRLVNKDMDAGYHSVKFNASSIASGVYFYSIEAGSFVDVKKMMLLK